jgi:hypothetical protein
MCYRWCLKLRMLMNTPEETMHPATEHVKNHLSGSEQCLVLWGLRESKIDLCAKSIARGIIKEGGMAFLFNGDQYKIERPFLERFGVETLEAFLKLLPFNDTNAWIIFDNISSFNLNFINRLVRYSTLGNLKFVLQFNDTTNALEALRWADAFLQVKLVEPILCCHWDEKTLHAYKKKTKAVFDVQLGIESGCINVINQAHAAELAVRWEMGARRLNRFRNHDVLSPQSQKSSHPCDGAA